jgi:hypothetical protein
MTPLAPTDPATCLAALMRRLQQLGAMDLPPGAQTMVASATAHAHTLAGLMDAESPPIIDHATFDGLLALAGPEVAPELLRQLSADLAGVATALSAALGQGDPPLVRAQTHILMALAGSVGAMPLYVAAERLNRAAHTGDANAGDADAGDGRAVLAGLADLRQFIDDARHTHPTKGNI